MPGNTFEAKFGQLCDAQIHDKAPGLDTFKVGFQLIEKTDDESRAVGVMGYKVNDQWVYIPCFWLKGQLKGFDSMYLKQQDMFVPLDEGWLNDVKHNQPIGIGEPFDKTKAKGAAAPGKVNVYGMAYLSNRKIAEDVLGLSLLSDQALEKMLTPPDPNCKLELKTWLPRLGKQAASSLVLTMNKNKDFANAVLSFYDPEDIDGMVRPILEKKADTDVERKPQKDAGKVDQKVIKKGDSRPDEEKGKLEVWTKDDIASPNLNDYKREVIFRDGVFMEDKRPLTSEVFEDACSNKLMQTPTVSGVYEVLMTDGSLKKLAVVLPWEPGRKDDIHGSKETTRLITNAVICSPSGEDAKIVPLTKILAKEPEKAKADKGDRLKGVGSKFDLGALTGMYSKAVIFDEKGTAILVHPDTYGTNSPSGISVRVAGNAWDGTEQTMNIVPTKKDGYLLVSSGTIYVPSNARVVKANGSKQYALGDIGTVMSKLFKEGMERIKLYSDGSSFSISDEMGRFKEPMTKTAALIRLARDFGIGLDTSKHMLEQVIPKSRTGGSSKSWYIMKQAAYDTFPDDEPNAMGDDYQQYKETYTSTGLRPFEEQSAQDVVKKSKSGVQEALDTATIRSMVKKTNTFTMIDDYVKDMAKALDRACRLLFLFYWHNDDYKERYGSQEMYDLESSLKDIIESLGDMVLFLKERSSGTSKGDMLGAGMSDNMSD